MTHKLDEYASGTIELPSGHWRWFTIRVNSLPENVCVSQLLVFANEGEHGDVMHAHVPSNLNQMGTEQLRAFALDPDEREILIDGGTVRISRRVDDRGGWWPVRPAAGAPYRTSTLDHRQLGEIPRSELVDLVRAR
jgi:hypothetical protein